MVERTISALIGAPLFLGLIYMGGPYTAIMVAVLTLLSLREFLQIGEKMGVRVWYKLTTIVSVVWLISLFIGGQEWMLPSSCLLAFNRAWKACLNFSEDVSVQMSALICLRSSMRWSYYPIFICFGSFRVE